MRASPQIHPGSPRRRPWVPALTTGVYVAVGIGLLVFAMKAGTTSLSPTEQQLVGRWLTAHGNVDTSLELRADRTVTVTQSIRVALFPGVVRTFGPTMTHGRWRVDAGRLRLETTADELRATTAEKLALFARSQRWPVEGALHRDWRIEELAPDRFGFTDLGSGKTGRAFKAWPFVAQGARPHPEG